jgi:hypothetical protein
MPTGRREETRECTLHHIHIHTGKPALLRSLRSRVFASSFSA